MGYMRHHAIIVTSYDLIYIRKAYQKATELDLEPIGWYKSKCNGYFSIFIRPDGSKEGWKDSEAGDTNRATFIAWLDTQRFEDKSSPYDWVEVQYGDDEGVTKITAHSDEDWRNDDRLSTLQRRV